MSPVTVAPFHRSWPVAVFILGTVLAGAEWLILGASLQSATLQGLVAASAVVALLGVSSFAARGALVFALLWLLLVLVPATFAVYDPVNGRIFATFGTIDYGGATPLGLVLGGSGLSLALLALVLKRPGIARSPKLRVLLPLAALILGGFIALVIAAELVIDETTVPVVFVTLWAALGGTVGWLVSQAILEHRVGFAGAVSGMLAGIIAVLPTLPWLAPPAGVVVALIASILGPLVLAGARRARFGVWSPLIAVCLVPGVVGMILEGVVANGIGFIYSGQLALVISQVEGTALVVCFAVIATAILAVAVDRTVGLISRGTTISMTPELDETKPND